MAQLRNRTLYVHLLRIVAGEPTSAVRIHELLADKVGRKADRTIRDALHAMHRLRLVYVSGWVRAKRGPDMPLWAMGDLPDAPRPASRKTGKQFPSFIRSRRRNGTEVIAFAALVHAMQEPQTTRALSDASGCCRRTVNSIQVLMRELGLAHIAEWDRERYNGPFSPCWQIGINKPDAPRPAALPLPTVQKRHNDSRSAKRQTLRITHALASNASIFTQAEAA